MVAVRGSDSVLQAEEQMSVADIRHLPVVDERHRVIGILSNRDLMRVGRKKRKELRVGDVMTRDVATVRPFTPAHKAATIMLERKINSLPVVGDEEQLVGIVTATDFLTIARDALLETKSSARLYPST